MTEFPNNDGDKVVIGRLIRQKNPDPSQVESAIHDIDESFNAFLKFVDELADTTGFDKESVSYARKFRELYLDGKVSVISRDGKQDSYGICGNSIEVENKFHAWVELDSKYYTGFVGTVGRKAQTIFASLHAVKSCVVEATSAFLANQIFLNQAEFDELLISIDKTGKSYS